MCCPPHSHVLCNTQGSFFFFFWLCSTFGLDSGSAINLYITTLLLQEDRWYETEIGEGDADAPMRCEESLLGEDDMLESALQIVPQLGSTKDLVISLNTALTKVSYRMLDLIFKPSLCNFCSGRPWEMFHKINSLWDTGRWNDF